MEYKKGDNVLLLRNFAVYSAGQTANVEEVEKADPFGNRFLLLRIGRYTFYANVNDRKSAQEDGLKILT